MHLQQDGYWTQRQVAEHLGVTRGTLARWRYEGYGPPHTRLGTLQRVVYRAAEVKCWLDQQFLNAPVW